MSDGKRPKGRDDYSGCGRTCHHALASGVLVSELLRSDGPHRQDPAVVTRFGLATLLRRTAGAEHAA